MTLNQYLFTSQRLGYRFLVEADIQYLEKLDSHPEVRQYFPTGVLNREQIVLRLNQFIHSHQVKGIPCFAVFHLQSGIFMGRAGFAPIDSEEIEVGYIFHKEFWGQGYATEALLRLLIWAKDNLDVAYIVAYTTLDHLASQHVLEKCNMKYYKNEIVRGKECRFYKKEL